MVSAEIPNLIFSILTIIGQIIIVITLVVLLVSWKRKKSHKLLDFLNKHAFLFAFIVALISLIGSLTYSEVVGFEPCKLCWFQRILIYPQVAILGMALLKRHKEAKNYVVKLVMVLLALNAIIAAYHYLLQRGIFTAASCSIVGYSVSCSQIFVLQFGYITIPMMSLTASLMILVFMLGIRLHDRLNR